MQNSHKTVIPLSFRTDYMVYSPTVYSLIFLRFSHILCAIIKFHSKLVEHQRLHLQMVLPMAAKLL